MRLIECRVMSWVESHDLQASQAILQSQSIEPQTPPHKPRWPLLEAVPLWLVNTMSTAPWPWQRVVGSAGSLSFSGALGAAAVAAHSRSPKPAFPSTLRTAAGLLWSHVTLEAPIQASADPCRMRRRNARVRRWRSRPRHPSRRRYGGHMFAETTTLCTRDAQTCVTQQASVGYPPCANANAPSSWNVSMAHHGDRAGFRHTFICMACGTAPRAGRS